MNKLFNSFTASLFLIPILNHPGFPNVSESNSQGNEFTILEEKINSMESNLLVKESSLDYRIKQSLNAEESPNFYIAVDKKNLILHLFQKSKGYDTLLLQTPVALGRQGHSTPSGNFYLRRVVENPFWYPTKSSKSKVPSKPGKNNPYGLWMSELLRQNEPGNYDFPISGDTTIRIHSTNAPSSIGKYASNGCIRLPPFVAEELFPIFLRYIPHKEPKKNARGIIYPLEKTIPVFVK